MCLVKYDISTVKIKKPRSLETSEECNTYSIHSMRTHNTGPLFYDQSNMQWLSMIQLYLNDCDK